MSLVNNDVLSIARAIYSIGGVVGCHAALIGSSFQLVRLIKNRYENVSTFEATLFSVTAHVGCNTLMNLLSNSRFGYVEHIALYGLTAYRFTCELRWLNECKEKRIRETDDGLDSEEISQVMELAATEDFLEDLVVEADDGPPGFSVDVHDSALKSEVLKLNGFRRGVIFRGPDPLVAMADDRKYLDDYGPYIVRNGAEKYVHHVGRVFLGKRYKTAGYGVFCGVYFVTLTSLTSGTEFVVSTPDRTLVPYLWKTVSGRLAVSYTGLKSTVKYVCDDELVTDVEMLVFDYVVSQDGYVTIAHVLRGTVNGRDDEGRYLVKFDGLRADYPLVGVLNGLPVFSNGDLCGLVESIRVDDSNDLTVCVTPITVAFRTVLNTRIDDRIELRRRSGLIPGFV